MEDSQARVAEWSAVLEPAGLERLITALRVRGLRVVGPTISQQAIVYDEIAGVGDLPWGQTMTTGAGWSRLRKTGRPTWFEFAAPLNSAKSVFYKAEEPLVQLRKRDGKLLAQPHVPRDGTVAFLGIRPCDVAALGVLDGALAEELRHGGPYAQRREGTWLLPVVCTLPGSTCFCTSFGTGPGAPGRFDLALAELLDGVGHRFLVMVGSSRGEQLLASIPHHTASHGDREQIAGLLTSARNHMAHGLPAAEAAAELPLRATHMQWGAIAARCVACGQCTSACPTCYCADLVEREAIDSEHVDRIRVWDSCFTTSHSYMHGGAIRTSILARYRQWLTHKLAFWHHQYGEGGCVGCGRCIITCPVGIDIRDEVQALLQGALDVVDVVDVVDVADSRMSKAQAGEPPRS